MFLMKNNQQWAERVNTDSKKISIIIPAKNEAESLATLLPAVRSVHPEAEIIVVNDGSTDETAAVAEKHAACVHHPYSLGNGAAIKSGARAATGDILVFMDGDGQHRPDDIAGLISTLEDEGYDMVIGARSSSGHANTFRRWANRFYNFLASAMVGHPVADLTSGMRATNAHKFREILSLLPNGFSYPTTSTMAFFRLGYRVGYRTIEVQQRTGTSHIRLLHDGFRFLLIIIKIGTLYSPLKLFVPLSAAFFATGLGYYLYTYISEGRFTNMAALLLMSSIFIFLFGLLSEQITTLLYSQTSRQHDYKQD